MKKPYIYKLNRDPSHPWRADWDRGPREMEFDCNFRTWREAVDYVFGEWLHV